MSGDIERAVREVQERGLRVVSDPIQAGVMLVMTIAKTAKLSIDRLERRVF